MSNQPKEEQEELQESEIEEELEETACKLILFLRE